MSQSKTCLKQVLPFHLVKLLYILLLTALVINLLTAPAAPEEAAVYAAASGSNPVSDSSAGYQSLYPDLYVSSEAIPTTLPSEEKIAYLTFDDGPSSLTPDILDLLEKENIKATFFVIGSGISDSSSSSAKHLRDIHEAGHVIGIHTYSHDYRKIYSSIPAFLEDFNKTYLAVYNLLGIKANIYRYPGGSNNVYISCIRDSITEEITRRGFSYYDWNVSAEDAVGKPTKASIKKNLEHAFTLSYPVLLMHDDSYNTILLKVLPDIISGLKQAGYRFDTLDNRVPIHFK